MVQATLYVQEVGLHHIGMVPIVAYMIVKGHVELTDEEGKTTTAGPGEVIGLRETWNHTPLAFDVKVNPGTSIIHLDRSLLGKFRKALVNPLT